MKPICSVSHISHGVSLTGGYIHEQFVFNSVCDKLEQIGFEVKRYTFRTNRFFKGLAQLKMVWFGIVNARSDVNFVSNWMALYAIWANLFSKRKIIITWHHHDEADAKTRMTRLYMKLLFSFLSTTQSKRIAILVVSPYWKNYFTAKVSSSVSILYFPNMFNTKQYQSFHQQKKHKQIYLGQLAFKTDTQIFELAHQLKQQGYYCFFTTLNQSEVGVFTDYDILYFQEHSSYLNMVAQSEYSIAYTKLNEGWNRVAHESILLGVQVVGVNKGGLGDLLQESNSLVAKTVNDIAGYIQQQLKTTINAHFVAKYDTLNQHLYSQQVTDFITR